MLVIFVGQGRKAGHNVYLVAQAPRRLARMIG